MTFLFRLQIRDNPIPIRKDLVPRESGLIRVFLAGTLKPGIPLWKGRCRRSEQVRVAESVTFKKKMENDIKHDLEKLSYDYLLPEALKKKSFLLLQVTV